MAFWLRSQVFPSLGWSATTLYPLEQYLPLLPITLVIWWFLLYRSTLYRSQRTVSLQQEAREILRLSIASALLLVLVIYALRLDDRLLGGDKISRAWIFLLYFLTTVLLLARTVAVRALARYAREKGYNYRTVVIVGTGATAARVADLVEQHGYWGLRILGLIAESRREGIKDGAPYPVIGVMDELPEVVEDNVVDEVIFALDRPHPAQLEALLLALEEQGVRSRLALSFLPHTGAKVEVGGPRQPPRSDLRPHTRQRIAADREAGDRCVDLRHAADGGVARHAGHRRIAQARWRRSGAVHPDPLWSQWSPLHALQVSHHGGRCRKPTAVDRPPERDERGQFSRSSGTHV